MRRHIAFVVIAASYCLLGSGTVASGQAPPARQPPSAPSRQQPPPPPSSGDRAAGGRAASGVGRQAMPTAALAPFRLSPEQLAQLDQVLDTWERESKKITTLSASFNMWEYDSTFGPANKPARQCEGEIYFAAPDRGMYREKMEGGAYWVCDGKSIYEVRHKKEEVAEYPLPEGLRGKAIANGPLPFVFGAEAAQIKRRYFMRVVTPSDAEKGQIWLEGYPKLQQDAANFHKVEVILNSETMLPIGLRLYRPNAAGNPAGGSRTVYGFGKPKVNDLWEKIKNAFNPPLIPRGWKRVVEHPPIARDEPPPQRGGQAQRVLPPSNRR